MLTDKLKIVLDQFKSINFEVSYNSETWEILFANKRIEKGGQVNSVLDSDILGREIMVILIPGFRLVDFNDNFLGDENSFHSIARQSESIIYYSARLNNNRLSVKETKFENELDLFIHLYKIHVSLYLSQSFISKLNIKSPLDLLKKELENLGYSLSGFKHGGYDDDGYSYAMMMLSDNYGKRSFVEYPERDAMLLLGEFVDIEDVEIRGYSKDQLKLLMLIKRKQLKVFIEENEI